MNTVWSDAAIRSRSEDAFDRVPYAVHAARLIASSHAWQDSIVFGLTGPWGSGKTSMLAMIEEELLHTQSMWKVAHFTPWATGDVGGLLEDFYASLAEALPRERARNARKALGRLARVSAPAGALIPFAGQAVAGVANAGADLLDQQVPWDKAFRKAAKQLKELETPVLLIADDIDRLQTDELLALLKVVRLLGRFPGVHYLLAYDEETLYTSLARADLVRGDSAAAQRFMEKIVQYSLVLPALTSYQLLSRLETGIAQVLADGQRTSISPDRLSELSDSFRTLLTTPRAVDRFLAQLRHHLPLLAEGEVDDGDVVVLTLLRTSFPVLYSKLPRWRSELTSGHTDEIKTTSRNLEWEGFDISNLLETVTPDLRLDAAKLIRDLFPSLPSASPVAALARPKGVGSERYFDRYFTMSVPAHDVPDSEVERMVDEAGSGCGKELMDILLGPDQERSSLVLEKAKALTDLWEDAQEPRLELLSQLTSVLERWPDDHSLFTSLRANVRQWIVKLLAGVPDQVPASDVISLLRSTTLDERSRILHRVGRHQPRPEWFPAAAAAIGVEVAAQLLAHLELADEAPDDSEVGWWITLLSDLQQGPLTKPLIAEGLAAGRFTIADVAARFVVIDSDGPDGVRRIADVRRDAFDALVAPVPDDWYTQKMVDVLPTDLSWPSRRAAAAGRFALPTSTDPS